MTSTFHQSTESILQARRQSEREIIARYAGFNLSPLDIVKIRQAEKDGAYCETCSGLPCKKSTARGIKPVVKVTEGGVRVKSVICRYARANNQQTAYAKDFATTKIPPIYIGKTFKDYTTDESNGLAVAWAHNAVDKSEGVYICGESGRGKTFLAAIIAQELLRKGKTVIFSDVPSLLEDLKATFAGDTRIDELMAKLATVDLLVLDDLGTETPTEWAVERLYMIVNQRYNAGKPVVVTSNLTPSDAADRLNHPKNAPVGVHGSRIISRIKQMCRIIEISGGDRRRK